MPNSSTLLQAIIAAFCAILCALSGMGGGGMGLIMRRNLMAGGGWNNPYVTDGLVAMWDGEWNAGGGRHTNDYSSWKDCVRGYDLIPLEGGSYSVSEKSMNIISGGNFHKSGGWAKQFVETMYQSPEITVEIGMSFEENVGSISIQPNAGDGGNNGRVFLLYASNVDYFNNLYWPVGRYTSGLGIVASKNELFTCSCSGTVSDVIESYKNGHKVTQVSTSSRWTVEIKDDASLNIGSLTSTSANSGKKYNFIRFYNRAISSSEIAENYTIDRARFGLT